MASLDYSFLNNEAKNLDQSATDLTIEKRKREYSPLSHDNDARSPYSDIFSPFVYSGSEGWNGISLGVADVDAPSSLGAGAFAQTPSDMIASKLGLASYGEPAAGVSASGPTQANEISFINALNPDGSLLPTGSSSSYWTTNGGTARKWGSSTVGTTGGTVTYCFASSSGFTATEQATVAECFALWSAETNIKFSLTTNASGANVLLQRGSRGSGEYFSDQGNVTAGSGTRDGTYNGQTLINFDTATYGFDLSGSFSAVGGYGLGSAVHEMGHLLGLGHGGPYNGSVNSSTQQYSAYDSRLWSVMSYIEPYDKNAKYYSSYPVTGTYWGNNSDGSSDIETSTTPMMLDILATQQEYGAPTSTPLSGGNVFGFHSNIDASIRNFFDFTVNTKPVVTLFDTGTNNTLDLSGFSTSSTVNLAPGTFSSTSGQVNNIGIAYNTVIDHAIGGTASDSFTGTTRAEIFTGGAGADTFFGNGGMDIYRDTFADLNNDHIGDFISSDVIDVTNASGSLSNLSYSNNTLSFTSGDQSITMTLDNVTGVVQQKADATGGGGIDIYFTQYPVKIPIHANDLTYSSTASGYNHFIDYPNFEASYSDLIAAFGTNQSAMANWYANNEPTERRIETFDGLDYVASYGDLINAFKLGGSLRTVQDQGANHYITNGAKEGRSTTFNGLDYIASHSDLIAAFGANNDAGAYHYIENGFKEGRTTTFDGLQYVASWGDLIKAIGANEQAGAAHYINNGSKEGRTTTFDGLAYVANYTDLMKAFGSNTDAGATHYITNGAKEGRTTTFDVAGYINDHPDLKGRFSTNDQFLTAYIDTYTSTGHYLT